VVKSFCRVHRAVALGYATGMDPNVGNVANVQALVSLLAQQAPMTVLAGVFATMWWLERAEVKRLQGQMAKIISILLSRRHKKEEP
jgi:hypothetical protein